MREFIYYSRTAPTAGNYIKEDLQASGRIDIAIHTIVMALFISRRVRTDTILHLVFAGPPDPTKHFEFRPITDGKNWAEGSYIPKKNVSALLKKMLYKCKEGEKREVFPGFWIEKKGFLELVGELHKKGREIFILDKDGEDIRRVEIKNNPVFVLGDVKGLPNKEFKRLKNYGRLVTIGKKMYLASQTVAVVNNELDRREDEGRL